MRAFAFLAVPSVILVSACTENGGADPIDTFVERTAQQQAIVDSLNADGALDIAEADLPDTGSASYLGAVTIEIDTLPALAGEMTLEANFADASFSAAATEFRDTDDTAYAGTLTVDTTDFDDSVAASADTLEGEMTGELLTPTTTINVDGSIVGNFAGLSSGPVDDLVYDPAYVTGTVEGEATVTIIGDITDEVLDINDGSFALEQID